jgi:hypothetical protein
MFASYEKLIVALLSAAGIALGSASAADSSNAAKGEKKEAVTVAHFRQRVEEWANHKIGTREERLADRATT